MYQTIQNLPIDYQFDNKTKEELKLYGIWFKENKDDRINHLIEIVKTTPSFEDWNADFTPNSLNEPTDLRYVLASAAQMSLTLRHFLKQM